MRKPEDVTVLVVDDEADVREFLASVLEDAGMRVETADNGNTALAMIRSRPPDLISADLVMPGKSGIRLIHELRKNPAWARIPVLIVTGHARDRDIKQGLDGVLADSSLTGPSTCLEKPVTPQGYLEEVCRLLGVEPPAEAALPTGQDALRQEAERLVRDADPETLARLLEQLRKDGPAGD
jgi:two-component system alkaline phosphatase synthesis response regulator PhoP